MSERDRHAYNTRSRTHAEQDQERVGARPGLEALGFGIAPGLTGDDRSERERAEIGAGQPGAARRRGPRELAGLVDEAVDRAAGRRRVRQALGMPSDRRIGDEVIDELLAGASTRRRSPGPAGCWRS